MNATRARPQAPSATFFPEISPSAAYRGAAGTAEFILLLKEGAHIQIAAEAIDGSRDYGPGVLAQQFRMSGLTELAKELGLLSQVEC